MRGLATIDSASAKVVYKPVHCSRVVGAVLMCRRPRCKAGWDGVRPDDPAAGREAAERADTALLERNFGGRQATERVGWANTVTHRREHRARTARGNAHEPAEYGARSVGGFPAHFAPTYWHPL